MKYRRTPVTTKEIVQYAKLRIERFKEELKRDKIEERNKLILNARMDELDRLISVINVDSIKNEISKMHHHKRRTKLKSESS